MSLFCMLGVPLLLLLPLAMSLGCIMEPRPGVQRTLGQDTDGTSGGCGYLLENKLTPWPVWLR